MNNLYRIIFFLIFMCVSNALNAEIKFGALIALSGATSEIGNDYANGLKDYIRYTNETGGVNGQKVNLIIKDTQYNTQRALISFKELVDDGVSNIIGWGTGTTVILAQHAKREKLPIIAASLFNRLVEPVNPFVFIAGPSYSDQFVALLKYANKARIDKTKPLRIAFVYNSTAFGRAPIEKAEKYAKENGIQVVTKQIVELNAIEADKQMKKIKSLGVDGIIIQETVKATLAILRSAKDIGLKDTPIYGTFYSGDNKVFNIDMDQTNDLIVASPFARWTDDNKGIKMIRDIYKKYHKDDNYQSVYYIQGFLIGKIYVSALKQVKSYSGDSVKEALESMNNIDTMDITSKFMYSADNHKGASQVRLYKANYEDEVFENITGWIDCK